MGKILQIHEERRNTKCISSVNSHSTSAAETMSATSKMNENSIHCSETPAVNGICKEQSVEIPLVNGKCNNEVSVNKTSTYNDSLNKIEKDTLMNKENCEEKMSKKCETAAEELSTASGICNKDESNGSSFPSENGNVEDYCDENDFIKVVNKRRRNRNKKGPNFNLPVTQKVSHNNGINNKKLINAPPSHIEQKSPAKDVFPVRNSEKSYSSVLINGQKKNSQTKNVCPDLQVKPSSDAAKCTKLSKSSNNCNLPSTSASLNHVPVGPAKNVTDNNTIVSHESENETLCIAMKMLKSSYQTDSSLNQSSPTASSSECVGDRDASASAACSANSADTESVVSNDSGRGDSEPSGDILVYYFLFPSDKAGLLIGTGGKYKNKIQTRTGATVFICLGHAPDFVTVQISGTKDQINNARRLIEKRFGFELKQYCSAGEWNLLTNSLDAVLPEHTLFPPIVSFMYNPGMFWVQPYGHPLQFQVEDLEMTMSYHYDTFYVPRIDFPKIGNIVAAPHYFDENRRKWVRSCITNINEEQGTVVVRYLDHGGEFLVPMSEIRPMRQEFFTVQFFAAECRLYGALPASGDVWSEEAIDEFRNLCQGNLLTVVEAKIPRIYYVRMYIYDNERNELVDIASILIDKGLAVAASLESPDLQ